MAFSSTASRPSFHCQYDDCLFWYLCRASWLDCQDLPAMGASISWLFIVEDPGYFRHRNPFCEVVVTNDLTLLLQWKWQKHSVCNHSIITSNREHDYLCKYKRLFYCSKCLEVPVLECIRSLLWNIASFYKNGGCELCFRCYSWLWIKHLDLTLIYQLQRLQSKWEQTAKWVTKLV